MFLAYFFFTKQWLLSRISWSVSTYFNPVTLFICSVIFAEKNQFCAKIVSSLTVDIKIKVDF